MKILLLLLVILPGCKSEPTDNGDLMNYVCTSGELDRVSKEFNICVKSGYFSAFCFKQAKKSICKWKGGKKSTL